MLNSPLIMQWVQTNFFDAPMRLWDSSTTMISKSVANPDRLFLFIVYETGIAFIYSKCTSLPLGEDSHLPPDPLVTSQLTTAVSNSLNAARAFPVEISFKDEWRIRTWALVTVLQMSGSLT